MEPSFDLGSQGFCRVRWLAGRCPDGVDPRQPLGLRQLLVHAHNIEDVEVSPPPALSGLLRVLAVLAGRVSGLDTAGSVEDWEERRDAVLEDGRFDPAAVHGYFDAYRGRFELFHTATEYPFLQDKRLLEQCRTAQGEVTSSGVNKLVLGRAAGQAFVWHSHTRDAAAEAVPACEAVWNLLAWLYYGVPGRCTPRRVGDVSAGDTKAGPLRGTISFHPVGSSLFHTLVLGLPYVPGTERAQDAAAWEEEPADPLGVPPSPSGLGRLLTGRFRHAVLLSPSESGESVVDARITWAWRHEHGPAEDPYLLHRMPKAGGVPFPEAASATKAVWRDVDALLGKTEGRRRPAVFTHLDEVESDHGVLVRIRALGFDQDRSQAKDRQFFAGSTPPLLQAWQVTSEQRWVRLRHAREAAESTGWNLDTALAGAWRELTGATGSASRSRDGGAPWSHAALMRYWDASETHFWDVVTRAHPPSEPLAHGFIRAALAAYAAATNVYAHTPRSVKIIESHRRRLWRGWQAQNRES